MSASSFYRDVLRSPRHIVAPMVNQSELPFRLLTLSSHSHLVFTPMLNSAQLTRHPSSLKYLKQHLTSHPNEHQKLIAQLCGDTPSTLLTAAFLLVQTEPSLVAIDLNLGCPQGIARRGHYGAFLLHETELLKEMVSTLVREGPRPVTCKIRILETKEKTIQLALALQESGCSLLTVHGRTKEQMKDKVGRCDWEMIREVKRALKIPVFANGGIETYADVKECLRFTGCDGVMSSEAILESPWLFDERYLTETPPTPFEVARQYLALCKEHPNFDHKAIRPHMFKFLFRPLSVHTEIRERFGPCRYEDIDALVDELERADKALNEEERVEKYRNVPSWYNRYSTYKNKNIHPAAVKQSKINHEDRPFEDRLVMVDSSLAGDDTHIESSSSPTNHAVDMIRSTLYVPYLPNSNNENILDLIEPVVKRQRTATDLNTVQHLVSSSPIQSDDT